MKAKNLRITTRILVQLKLEYFSLKESGMMWEYYPSFTGIFEVDKDEWFYHTYEEMRHRFERYLLLWNEDVQFLSSSTTIQENKHYLRIIDEGVKVLPLILESIVSDLEKDYADHWFVALEKLVGRSPSLSKNQGNIQEMLKTWVSFLEEEKILDFLNSIYDNAPDES